MLHHSRSFVGGRHAYISAASPLCCTHHTAPAACGRQACLLWVQGTAKRWEVVTAYVRTRTQEEVLDMVKHGLKSRKTQAKTEQFSIAKKRQANTTIKSDPTGRMESFTDVDVNIAGGATPVLLRGRPGMSACLRVCRGLQLGCAVLLRDRSGNPTFE